MKYVEAVNKIRVNIGDNFKNIVELRNHLEKVDTHPVDMTLVFKEVFDSNLKPDFDKITASGGTCGYWAMVYYKFFKKLGYDCTIKSLQGENSLKLSHIWVEIDFNDAYIELDKLGAVVTKKGADSNYEKILKSRFIRDFGMTPVVVKHTEDYTTFYRMCNEVAILDFPADLINEFTIYMDFLIANDIDKYEPTPLKEFFTGFQLMYIHLTDTNHARNIKELIKEKKTRAKYKK